MSRLSIEIEPEQHRAIKTLATFSGMSIKDYILKMAIPQKAVTTDDTDLLLSSPQNAKRLSEAMATPAESHKAFESINELKKVLGI